jgi:hypothetical protein
MRSDVRTYLRTGQSGIGIPRTCWSRRVDCGFRAKNACTVASASGRFPAGACHASRRRPPGRSAPVSPASDGSGPGYSEQLSWFHTKCISKSANDPKASEECSLFELAEIAPANLSIVREVVLREPLLVAQATQVGGEQLAQIHPPNEACCSKCAPRYIEQNATGPRRSTPRHQSSGRTAGHAVLRMPWRSRKRVHEALYER